MNLNLLPYVSHHLQWVVVVLVLVGMLLKRIPQIPNGVIPVMLCCLSVMICTIYTFLRFRTGSVMDMLMEYGIPDGIPLTATAAWGWDLCHGLSKARKKKKEVEP